MTNALDKSPSGTQSGDNTRNLPALPPVLEKETPIGVAEEAAASPFDRFLFLVAGDERRRFLVGSVVVPISVALLIISLGTHVASSYQDWQDRRNRGRDTVSSIREAAAGLSIRLQNLENRGEAIERIWSQKPILPLFQAVDESLLKLEGLASAISRLGDANGVSATVSALSLELKGCRGAVSWYSECLIDKLSSGEEREIGTNNCTDGFRERSKATSSCNTIMSTSFSFIY